MGRLLAIDYGTVRCGIAVTDELQIIASGLTTVKTTDVLNFLSNYAKTEAVEKIIIGLPRQMNNQVSESEGAIRIFIEELKLAIPEISIERQDERFTSKIAMQSMIDGGLKKKKRQDKARLDEISATLILQSYIASNS